MMVKDEDIMLVAMSGGLASSGLLLVFLGFVQSFYRELKERGFYPGWREDAAFVLVWAIALAATLATVISLLSLLWLVDWWRIPIDIIVAMLVATIGAMMGLALATVIVLVKR